MRCRMLLFAGLLGLSSGWLFAGIAPSEWDFYCRKCHIDRPVNSLYDPSIKAHADGSISCVACHTNKGIAGHVQVSEDMFRWLFQDATLPPDIRRQKNSSVTSDQCLRCHAYIWEVDEILPKKLPGEERSIRLRAAHRQHWDYREFTPEQREKMKTLAARVTKLPLGKADQDLLSRLSQIETMECYRCHERFKKDSPGGVDANVNIAMKNPMECTACHIALRTAIHPGGATALPSAVACERCHHGNLHQKMIFFPVDYGKEADCLLCHPGYTHDALIAVRPEQFGHRSTQGQNREGINKPMENQANRASGEKRIADSKPAGAKSPVPMPIKDR